MQVQLYRLSDEAPVQCCRFSRASLDQLKNYFCRIAKLAESSVVDTLIYSESQPWGIRAWYFLAKMAVRLKVSSAGCFWNAEWVINHSKPSLRNSVNDAGDIPVAGVGVPHGYS